MISNELQTIISEITKKTHDRQEALNRAASWREKELEYRTYAADSEKKAKAFENEIDQLQLAMRTVLNGEPSTVKVEPPAQPEEQIGREG